METVILTVVFLVLLMVLPTLLYRRAALKIIALFNRHQAVGSENAKTLDELGLRPPGTPQRLLGMRDYRPRALQALLQGNVIKLTAEGKYYLAEKRPDNA